MNPHGNATSPTDMFIFYWDYLPLHHSWSDLVQWALMDKVTFSSMLVIHTLCCGQSELIKIKESTVVLYANVLPCCQLYNPATLYCRIHSNSRPCPNKRPPIIF